MAFKLRSLLRFSINLHGLVDSCQEALRVSKVVGLRSLLNARLKHLIVSAHVSPLEPNAKEDAFEPLRSQVFKAEVLSELLAIVDLNSQLLDKFYLPKGFFNGRSVLGDLMSDNTSSMLVLLENVHIVVAKSAQEGSAAEACRSSTDYGNWLLIRRWEHFR